MNGQPKPRRTREESAPVPPGADEAAVLREVLTAIRSLDFGSIQVTVQDSRVVQIDVTRKRRL